MIPDSKLGVAATRTARWGYVVFACACGIACVCGIARIAPAQSAASRGTGSGSSPARYAFLVGINSYSNLPAKWQLRGCEADARLMGDVLASRYGVAPSHIRIVQGLDATRSGILDGLDWLLAQGRAGDALLFFYSGHGTQITDADGDEADGLDEALCPSDIRMTGPNQAQHAILDDEVHERIQRAARDREFVAIYDCCHSGTGLRSVFAQRQVKYLYYEGVAGGGGPKTLSPDGTRRSRAVLPASTIEPAGQMRGLGGGATRGLVFESYVAAPSSDAPQRGRGFDYSDAGWPPAPPGVVPRSAAGSAGGGSGRALIAAARDYEVANDGEPLSVGGREEIHGVLTAALYRFLGESADASNVTYEGLKRALERPLIAPNGATQNPQVEVDSALLARPFLGGRSIVHEAAGQAQGGASPTFVAPTSAAPTPVGHQEPTATPRPQVVAWHTPAAHAPDSHIPPRPEPQAPAPAPPQAVNVVHPVPQAQPSSQESGVFHPQPLRVALARVDEVENSDAATQSLDPGETGALRTEIGRVLREMPDVATPVALSDTWNMLAVYGARRVDERVYHNVAVFDGNTRLVAQYATGSPADAAAEVRCQACRMWMVTNLLATRQPSTSRVNLQVRIDEARTRGLSEDRRRYRLGESVVFGIRSNRDGYLTLVNIACDGSVNLLYPNNQMTSNREGFIRGGERLTLPGPGTGLEQPIDVIEPVGPECVKAFLTPRPMVTSPREFQKALAGSGTGQAGAGTLDQGNTGATGQGGVGAASQGSAGVGLGAQNVPGIMRGIGGALNRAVAVRPASAPASGGTASTGFVVVGSGETVPSSPGGRIEWDAIGSADWGECTLLFTTGR